MTLTTAPAPSPVSQPAAATRRQARLPAIGSTVGSTIEWYDFFLYNTAAALVFPALFFPGSSAYAGRLEAFATYAVGFAARPVGAAIFGHWGDRLGRKATLIVSLLLMGGSSVAVGLMPGTASIGLWAPLLLVTLRLVQGIAVGGEFGGAVLMTMEWGDQRRRGLMASIPGLGAGFGMILGTGFFQLLSWRLTDQQFQAWGWRLPFLFSSLMVVVGLFIRLQVLETPMFAHRVEHEQLSRLPVVEVIRAHWRTIVLCALSRMSEQAPFYVLTAFGLGYMTHERRYSPSLVLAAIMCGAAVELVVAPLAGHLSDRFGRKRIYAVGSILTGTFAFVLFAAIDSGIGWVAFIAVVTALVPHALQAGPQAAMIAESFPTPLRYAGTGLACQLASLIAGGPAPLVATWLLVSTGSVYAVALAVAGCTVVTLVALALLTDRSGADIEDDAVYA